MTHSLTQEHTTRDQLNFVPFAPVPINAEIFLDVELTPIEKTVLALAEIFRLEIERQRTTEQRREAQQQIRASKFCEALQKSRDHVRRLLSQMRNKEAVKKYVSIFFVRDKYHNNEDQIIFVFKNHRVDSIALDTLHTNSILGQEMLEFHDDVLLKTYLQNSVCFSKEKPLVLAKTCDVKVSELVKGILYVDIMQTKRLHEKKVPLENPIGYLIRCFDDSGKFKYELKPHKYLSNTKFLTTESNVEYELTKETFSHFSNILQDKNENKVKFVFTERNNLIYLKTISKTGKKWNPVVWLKKYGMNFKVVSELQIGGVK